ncbi:dTDP-4-dehydrorhamnose 3,5-epimerase family protein [Streptomyces sp. DSM 44915]|uniref:dTDP-4-dehydrorhamnose 3,5-epimerase family protein n=1 Tax=Streptomyces chisholmiae TaxID=3075540 RepID=A0ABU2K0Q9_9ACTN|nr:dTDP-4-dehydrorhamnose 3,5-epimerase family protein [Streptomyces sp. DSM 44915]MDT0270824.1 dTDP-4-dehydrorhamnose 3,5-epimerase family protein [Streptomyces sp. DSM 44915]
MRVERTVIPGARVVTPHHHVDERGELFESLRTDLLARDLGRPFAPRQITYSTSRRNTLRGLHSVAAPPGQAKYVTCVRGALRDIIVDLRVGSPAWGRHHVTELDAASGRSVFIPEGVAHGFLALTDDTRVCYVLSTVHVPGTQIDIDPLDPELALPWGFTEPPLMSEKDAGARSLAATRAAGLLARWGDTGDTGPLLS